MTKKTRKKRYYLRLYIDPRMKFVDRVSKMFFITNFRI